MQVTRAAGTVPDMTDLSFATEPLTLRGALLSPDAPGYDTARRVHNGLIDKRPAAIARCQTRDDVVQALELSDRRGFEVSVRGGGHNVAGRAVTDGGLMIDLSPMRGIVIDPVRRRARVQAGVLWRELDQATAQHGLATTGGVVSTTGVAGLTLGGGIGHLMGSCGLTVDNLLSAEVVAADGRCVLANGHQHEDLFWALRGGGGNFGIVTEFEFSLHPVAQVTTGLLVHPADVALEVLRSYRELAATAPDQLSVSCGLVHAPDGASVIAVPICWTGDARRTDSLLSALRLRPPLLDTVSSQPYPAANQLLDEGFPRGALSYWKSAFVGQPSDGLLESMVAAYAEAPSPMSAIVFENLHGAATRVEPSATAFPHRGPGHSVLIAAQWQNVDETQDNVAWARRTYAALLPHAAGGRYVNYLGADEPDAVRAAYGANWDRLLTVKRAWDPDNVLHLNHNIDPRG